MLQSMTGYGEAQHEADGISFIVEFRSLNNRFLKTIVKLPDALSFAEPHIERIIRARLARGSVTCVVHMRYTGAGGALTVNQAALQSYLTQLSQLTPPEKLDRELRIDLATLLQLPGVCQPHEYSEQEHQRFLDIITDLTSKAVNQLCSMRSEEGKSLLADIETNCKSIQDNLSSLTALTGGVVEKYQQRLQQRVNTLLAQGKLEIEADMLAREVALFAERCDINEELSRLDSHLDQFLEMSKSGDQVGRRLDFLTQELLREANTISSKANDARISQHVVEIKVAIDRLKEQVQNIE